MKKNQRNEHTNVQPVGRELRRVEQAPRSNARKAKSTAEVTTGRPLTAFAREVATFFKDMSMKRQQASEAIPKRRPAIPRAFAIPRSGKRAGRANPPRSAS